VVQLSLPGLVLARNHDAIPGSSAQSIDNRSLPFFRVDELAVPFASTLIPHLDKQPDAQFHVLMRTSWEARATSANVVRLRFDNFDLHPESPPTSRVVAMSVDGMLRSAFARDMPPAKGRLLVISSAQYLANPLARAGNAVRAASDTPLGPAEEDLLKLSLPYAQQWLTQTILSFKGTLDWMTIDDDQLACVSRELD
jgi:hypothetical protein